MNFNKLTDDIVSVDTDKNYWFVRTNKGANFNTFNDGKFIAIGWDFITTKDLENKIDGERVIKEKIRNELEKEYLLNNKAFDLRNSKVKQKITAIYNKILKFKEFKKGDLVIIPSVNSSMLAFGHIIDEGIYNEYEDKKCSHQKRRRVKWDTVKELGEIDSIFFKMVNSKQAICSVKNYANSIDKVVNIGFIKEEKSHLVLNVKTKSDISQDTFISLVTNFKEISEIANVYFNLNEDLSESVIKLNLQSPGSIELVYKNSKRIFLVAIALGLISCGDNETRNEVQKFKEINGDKLKKISEDLDKLEIPRN